MFEYLFEKVFKKIINDTSTEILPSRVKPDVEPYEDPYLPQAPDIPKPKRRVNPLKPDPGVHPEPKGLSNEIEIFLNKHLKNTKIKEAFDPGKFPSFVHKDKKNWIVNSDEQLRKLLPNLSNSEQSYLEMISSNVYKEMISRLEKYSGIKIKSSSLPHLVNVLETSLKEVMNIEKDHKDELEKLAISSVLNFDEFELVKDAYENGDIKFDVKLSTPELNWNKDDNKDDNEDDLSQEETLNVELAKEFSEIENESRLKRRMANLLIQGSAVLKTYLFNLISDELSDIDPSLPNLYGILGVLAQLGYWVTPDGIEKKGSKEAGSEEVIPDGDEYIIKVRATTFPFLVHELVKGIYEWISIDPDVKSALKHETIPSETHDIMIGSEIFKVLSSYIPANKQKLVPLVHKKYLQLSNDEMKDILSKSQKGKDIMNGLISDSEDEYKEYMAG
jgi:hypothetical protein